MADWIVSAVSAGWIVSYRCIAVSLDIAGSGSCQPDWLDWIGWIRLDNNGWMRTHSFCKDGTDGMDGNDGNDGLNWGVGGTGVGRTVVSARRNGSNRTGAPPLAVWLLQTRDEWDR